MAAIHIGVDLDNTIIDYSQVFAPVAQAIGLLPPDSRLTSKNDVKAFVQRNLGEDAWMRLQGLVYGRYIERATPFVGFAEFLQAVRAMGARVYIVSHKTRHGHFDPDRADLWAAARQWLERRHFLAAEGTMFGASDIFFEETRAAKIGRIAAVGCGVFIDDLLEVLEDPGFPPDVERLWFAPDGAAGGGEALRSCRTWNEVLSAVSARL